MFVNFVMSLIEKLQRQLAKTSNNCQLALAAECGNRVVTVYQEYWVGTFFESVESSIDIGWDFAKGNPVDVKAIDGLVVQLRDLVEFYYEEGIEVLATTVTVPLRILQAISSGNDDDISLNIARSLIAARDTAQFAEAMANINLPEDERVELAMQEEIAWQENAIVIGESWTEEVKNDMFKNAGKSPPDWIKFWLEHSVR